jgi:hypothetical protein
MLAFAMTHCPEEQLAYLLSLWRMHQVSLLKQRANDGNDGDTIWYDAALQYRANQCANIAAIPLQPSTMSPVISSVETTRSADALRLYNLKHDIAISAATLTSSMLCEQPASLDDMLLQVASNAMQHNDVALALHCIGATYPSVPAVTSFFVMNQESSLEQDQAQTYEAYYYALGLATTQHDASDSNLQSVVTTTPIETEMLATAESPFAIAPLQLIEHQHQLYCQADGHQSREHMNDSVIERLDSLYQQAIDKPQVIQWNGEVCRCSMLVVLHSCN